MARRLVVAAAVALVLAACGGASTPSTTYGPVEVRPGDPVNGARVYTGVCSACHSRDLTGVQGLGAALAPNDLIAESTEVEIVELLIEGRPAEHPDNSTGIDMPPRGGNPALTDQDLADVAAYLKAQNGG